MPRKKPMKHQDLPGNFTRLGCDAEGREYIQCTRTGDVLVQTGPNEWGHFATPKEWRAKTAAKLYPELIHLQRALKEVGRYEDIEQQAHSLNEAITLMGALTDTVRKRIQQLQTQRIPSPRGSGTPPRSESHPAA